MRRVLSWLVSTIVGLGAILLLYWLGIDGFWSVIGGIATFSVVNALIMEIILGV